MLPDFITARAAVLLALLGAASGCTVYHPRPVTFQVRDGDTGGPVSGAKVQTRYNVMLDFGVLLASVGPGDGVTDSNGDLALDLDARKRSFDVTVTAADYPDNLDGTRSYLGSPKWGRLLPGPSLWSRDEYQVRLFRGPLPTADVTLPDGYRGPVVVRLAADGGPPARGRRAFSYTATPAGVVEVPDGAVFECGGYYGGFRARYGGGPPLPTFVPDPHRAPPDPEYVPHYVPADAVALRFVTASWPHHAWLYVVGTGEEAEAVRRLIYPDRDHFDEAALLRLLQLK